VNVGHVIVGHVELIRGEWVPGSTAGGSRNDLESFAKNPQYLLTLTAPGEIENENIILTKVIQWQTTQIYLLV